MAFRKKILLLASNISLESGTYTGETPNDPEYMILDHVVTDEMADVGMHVKVRKPRHIEEIAKKAGTSVEYAQAMVNELVKCGIVRCVYDGDVETYYYPIWVPGIMEGMLSVKEQVEKYPVIAECFERYTRYRTPILVPNFPAGMGPMRAMPVGSAIRNDSHAATYDEVEHIIERAWAISVGPCSCRRTRRLMGEGCGHLEDDMCMYIDDNAKFFSQQGIDKRTFARFHLPHHSQFTRRVQVKQYPCYLRFIVCTPRGISHVFLGLLYCCSGCFNDIHSFNALYSTMSIYSHRMSYEAFGLPH